MRDSTEGDITKTTFLEPLIASLHATRGGSKALLRAAVDALATEGVAGCLTIHIPRKPQDHLEVEFSASTLTQKGG